MTNWVARQETLGGLDCRIVEFGSKGEIAVILCHGYGAPGDDLVSLAEVLIDYLGETARRFRFVFPAAPLQPGELAAYGGRAWWEINMAALLAASQSKSFSQLHDKTPPGIDRATEMLVACIEETRAGLVGKDRRYVLGGFSQGAMLTMNTTLESDLTPPELLVQFSGTLVCRTRWDERIAEGRLRATDVIQSHGRIDPILPFSSAEALHELLAGRCRSAEFHPFNGPHTIPMEALSHVAGRLRTLVGEGD